VAGWAPAAIGIDIEIATNANAKIANNRAMRPEFT
jgi:hypothetical protein